MNFVTLTPNDSPINDSRSDMIDSNFGGQRQKLNKTVGDPKDYTKRTGACSEIEENPVEDVTRDIDEMSNSFERKDEFTYQEIKSNVQEGNNSVAIQSDPENRPLADNGSDPVIIPETVTRKQLKKSNRWQFDKSDKYEGELS